MTVVPLEDVKDHLKITKEDYDSKLTGYIASAEAVISQRVGPLVPTTVTERIPGATGPLSLRTRPVISLTTVTPSYGNDLDITNLDVDPVMGLVAFKGYWSSFVSYFPMAYYTITYQAGYDTLPDDLALGIKEQVRLWWEASQRGPRNSEAPNFTIHPIVEQIISPYDHPVFA